jgi:ADP-ribose pyrophosphatase YjhB (NUDIX family)
MAQKFCHDCGQPLVETWHVDDAKHRLTCSRCGSTHYDNPTVLVWCLVHCGETMLLCQRAIEPGLGMWNPPGGFVEAGESLEEAMARELKEEAGIELPASRFILYRVASVPHMNQIYVGFRVEFESEPTLNPGPEAADAQFVSERTLGSRKVAFNDMIPDKPADVFARLRTREFAVRCLTFRSL